MVLGAVGMMMAGMCVAYNTSSGMEWGAFGDAPIGALSVDVIPTIIAVACIAAATAFMAYACKSRKG